MKYKAPDKYGYIGLYEYTSEDKKDKRIMAMYCAPLHWYDFKEQKFVNEREFCERFRTYREKEYHTTQENVMRFLKKWSIQLAKCPLRVLWVILIVLTSPLCSFLLLLYPLEWLIVGKVFNPFIIFDYVDNLRKKL